TEKERDELRTVIEELRRERGTIEGAVVQLESYYEPPSQALLLCSPARARKLDLETAVLMQEVMSMREEKADLNASVYQLEKEKEALEQRLAAILESQQQGQSGQATVQHLRTLKEAGAYEKKFADRDSRPHMRSRSKHSGERSADRGLPHQNLDLRQRSDPQSSNSNSMHNQERSRPKPEPKPQRLEAHVLDRVGRHSQVHAFRQRLAQMLDTSRHSSSHGSS
ncbi:colorectal mutant cancer protein-like, partial [Nilaparvata lugens]|uniref:colorectal mutant cancer protein-like n=1 Tax=Nilaparvata lugens TaxID=108931 RepID=UPI00193CB525